MYILVQLGNIFLNENLHPKVSLCILSNKLKEKGGVETMASDVFSFGVVLLQLLTGRKPKSLVDEVCCFNFLKFLISISQELEALYGNCILFKHLLVVEP